MCYFCSPHEGELVRLQALEMRASRAMNKLEETSEIEITPDMIEVGASPLRRNVFALTIPMGIAESIAGDVLKGAMEERSRRNY